MKTKIPFLPILMMLCVKWFLSALSTQSIKKHLQEVHAVITKPSMNHYLSQGLNVLGNEQAGTIRAQGSLAKILPHFVAGCSCIWYD